MNVLDRYRSIGRRLHNLVVPVFKGQVMSGRHEPRIRRQHKQRVLTVKENRIDETSLAVILARRAQKSRVRTSRMLPMRCLECMAAIQRCVSRYSYTWLKIGLIGSPSRCLKNSRDYFAFSDSCSLPGFHALPDFQALPDLYTFPHSLPPFRPRILIARGRAVTAARAPWWLTGLAPA